MNGAIATVAVFVALIAAGSTFPQVDVQFPFGHVNVRKGAGGGVSVDVAHPAGTVNVNKASGGRANVDVVHPAGTVNVVGTSSSSDSKVVSSSVTSGGVNSNNVDIVALVRAALGLNNKHVDVAYPGGSVNVNKVGSASDVDVAFPGGAVKVLKGDGTSKNVDVAFPGGNVMVRRSPQRQRQRQRIRERSGQADVAYPGGSVNVNKQPGAPSNVDVVYPGGSVNVGNHGTNNVDVSFPGGFVKLDPTEPGRRRSGVVVFPFGSVRFG